MKEINKTTEKRTKKGKIVEYFFAELDTDFVRNVTVTSRNGDEEQVIALNSDGVFRFNDKRSGSVKIMRLPAIKLQVFCDLICDMLAMEDDTEELDGSWSILARDRYGKRYRADGFAVSFLHRPNQDPSVYLRKATGLKGMWLLDGKKL